jgi:hypothetical protein
MLGQYLVARFGQMSPNLKNLTIVVVEENVDVRRH